MKVSCIIQARVGSTRLPRKVLLKLAGKEVLIHTVERVLKSKRVDEVVVATTTNPDDDEIEQLIKGYGNSKVKVSRGSEDDVLDRYYQAAKQSGADIIVRVTSDCPLIDPQIIDKAIARLVDGGYDYVSNVMGMRTFPRGLDTEVFTYKALENMAKNCSLPREREHVTTHIRENPDDYKVFTIRNDQDLSGLRWTVDEPDDFKLMEEIFSSLKPGFKTEDVLKLLEKRPSLKDINAHVEQKKNVKDKSN